MNQPGMFADLHLHTKFSDGTYTPEELAAQAQRFGFKAVALTDHDTVEGCVRMAAACHAAGIEFIPASELTADMNGHELHLLGYYGYGQFAAAHRTEPIPGGAPATHSRNGGAH
jgi:predicted metal-dependent phosphoesterase TrpH